MSVNEIKEDLRTIRNLNKRGIVNELTERYKDLFAKLPTLEQTVMVECYINGRSYCDCGNKIAYCERQVYRIVHTSIHLLNDNITMEREQ